MRPLCFHRVWETATGKTVAEFPAGKGVWWSRTVDCHPGAF
jgi:hypothetical protein